MAKNEVPKSIKASLYIDGKPAEASLKNIEQVTRTLERDFKKCEVGTEEWLAQLEKLKEHKKYIAGIKQELNGTAGAFSQIKAELGKVGSIALGYLGFQFVSDQFQSLISNNAKLSDSLADVRKTTGLTEAQVLNLNKELGRLETRTSRKELLGLAEVAGKLGISAEKDVLGFVRAADQIAVALGKDLGNTEQAVNDLGKLTDLFNIKEQFGLEMALLKTGSAINSLGAAGTANEGYIVEFTKRLGTIAPAANISIENVLGLAATMDELGQPAEAASTALAQFIVGMGKDLPTFAKVAGMSVQNFGNLLRKDGNEALIAVLTNLKATGGGVEELAAKMGMIGEDGARATAALGALSNNLGKLRDRQQMANDEFAKGTSLTDEFNVKNQNFGATLDKISKWFYGIATSKVITNTLTGAAEGFARLVGITRAHSEELDREQTKLYAHRIELQSNNTTQERRKEILEDLKATYPGLLSYLDTENTKNSDLLPILEKINEQYVVRIAYQQRMEQLDEAIKDEAESMNDVYDNNQKLIMQIGKIQRAIAEDGIKFTIQGRNEQEKATYIYQNLTKAINEQARTNKNLNQIQASNKYENMIAGMTNYGNAVRSANEALTKNKGERLSIEKDARNFKNSFTYSDKDIKGSEQMQIQANLLWANTKKLNQESKEFIDGKKKVQQLNTVIAMQRKAEELASRLNDKSSDKNKLRKEIAALNYQIAQKKKEYGLIGDANSKTNPSNVSAANVAEIDSIENLRLKLKEVTEARDKAVRGSKEFWALDKEARKLQAEIDKYNPKKNAREIKDAENLKKDLEQLNEEVFQNSLSRWAKEMAQVDSKYDKLRIRAKGNKEQLAEIDRLQDAERKNVERKIAEDSAKTAEESAKKIIENKQKIYEATLSENDLEYYRMVIHYEKLIELAEEYGQDTQALKQRQFEALQALEKKQRGDKTPEQLHKDEVAKRTKQNEEYLKLAQSSSDGIFNVISNRTNAEANLRISSIERQREDELKNKKLTEKQKEEINAKYDARVRAERKRQWQSEQRAAIAQAIVNGALAMTKVFAETGLLGFAFSPAVAAATALQIGVIAAQKAPEFAEGGLSDEDPAGYVSNTTLFRNSSSGRPFVAGEKGREWIAPNWMLENPVYADIIGSLEVARKEKRMYASGGFNNSSGDIAKGGDNLARLEGLISDFVIAQDKTNKKKTYLSYRELEEFGQEIEKARIRQTG